MKRKIKKKPGAELVGQITTVVKCTVECSVCGEGLEDEFETTDTDEATDDFADWVASLGWKIGESESLEMQGIMCPTCLDTPDESRGDR